MGFSKSTLWTDEELGIAISAYLYILYLEQRGIPYSVSKLIKTLKKEDLPRRSAASIRYRMRNITFVLQQLNWPTIETYYPAANVGTGVRHRIETIISSLPNKPPFAPYKAQDQNQLKSQDKKNALDKLNNLYDSFSEFDSAHFGIGHNHPPEPIEEMPINRDEIFSIKKDIQAIKEQLEKSLPNKKEILNRKDKLLDVGLKLSVWLGKRLTKLSDAAAVVIGTALGAKIMGLIPLISDAIRALIAQI